MTSEEKALLRVVLATYLSCVSNRLYHRIVDNPLESAARDAIYKAIKVDVAKIDYDGKADTVLWSKLLALYNDTTGENRNTLT